MGTLIHQGWEALARQILYFNLSMINTAYCLGRGWTEDGLKSSKDIYPGWEVFEITNELAKITEAAHSITIEALTDARDGQTQGSTIIASIGALLAEITAAARCFKYEIVPRGPWSGKDVTMIRQLIDEITKPARALGAAALVMPETPDAQRRAAVLAEIREALTEAIDDREPMRQAFWAAKRAGELLDCYRNTLTDTEIRAEPIIQLPVRRRHKVKAAPADNALDAIKRYCRVKCWLFQEEDEVDPCIMGPWRVIFFGLEADVQFARYLYKTIEQSIEDSAAQFKKSANYRELSPKGRRRLLADWKTSDAEAIGNLLIETAEEAEEHTNTASGTALVAVTKAIVEKAFSKLGITLG
jgi:hypothetical protein